MKFVIRFGDGTYSQGDGTPGTLAVATMYESTSEAQAVADSIGDADVIGCAWKPVPSPEWVKLPTLKDLIDCIERSQQELTVCVPSDDYYARAGETSEKTITFINPGYLIGHLRALTGT